MADKREDKGTDEGQEKQKPFIREKIVRQPPSGRQIMRKILMTGACAVVFGTAAAEQFSAVKFDSCRQSLRPGGDRAGADHHCKG